MNVYDFDKTIYDGDSTVDFYLYCLSRHPKLLICAFEQIHGLFLYKIGEIDTTKFKEYFFAFLKRLPNLDSELESFWDLRQSRIKKWYFDQKQKDDVVISASPDFLLVPICKRLEIAPPIATRLDIGAVKIQGANCKGAEKVQRFFERYPNEVIHRFYSDSSSDTPLAVLAEEAFFVRGNSIVPWT